VVFSLGDESELSFFEPIVLFLREITMFIAFLVNSLKLLDISFLS